MKHMKGVKGNRRNRVSGSSTFWPPLKFVLVLVIGLVLDRRNLGPDYDYEHAC